VDDIIQLERDCADAWPAVIDRPLGQWRLRAADGFTGRANSALTIGNPGVAVEVALDRVKVFADEHGIKAAAHVVTGSSIEPDLAEAGWAVDQTHPGGAESVVMTGPVDALTSQVPADTTVSDEVPAGWWPLAVGAARPTPAQRTVLAGGVGGLRLDGLRLGFGAARSGDGQVVGVVRGAVVGDLLHIARLAVAETHRRRGLGTGLLSALAEWGGRRGATRCALQVAIHNRSAIDLYTGLGCATHHGYRYWTPAS
jgi:ribosomal protein S18 acetylase RimI-like enzyme